ncbi:MAG TPA: NAD-dependent epimerase/dehydratase family protein [Longimicrobiaceae bacterium]|nr:NAD-dependent epimerase/dehydratase family protein [Longimicrobiaceae bacterium]
MIEKRILILGCGYVGERLASRLCTPGAEIVGTTRSRDRMQAIEDSGARAVIADVTDPSSLTALARWRPHIVYDLVRPQRTGDDRYTAWGTGNVAAALKQCDIEALVYLSSTSVYGRRSGEWTDESTPVQPSSPLGEVRARSEQIYLDEFRRNGFPVRICRSPGIYGPGRTLRQRLESGAYRRVDDEGLWVSRIHVEDLVSGLIAAWKSGRDGEVYLLCDDHPVTGREYAELTAGLLSLPLPAAVDRDDIRQELSHSAYERRVSARRCSNRRMHDELKVNLRFPSIREGVPDALREEGAI